MKKQQANITAKSRFEYEMRIRELIKRGFEVEKEYLPEETEHKQFTYSQADGFVNKTHKETDFQKKYRATMVRYV